MPIKPKTPQHVIDEAVKRYLAGEQVAVLAKYYKISKPGFYLWVAKYKKEHASTPSTKTIGFDGYKDLSKVTDKATLLAEINMLRDENRKLRDRLLTSMIRSGEI